jgi:mannose-6-phosphate isomerase-like protein (cupin superfamily)
VDTKPELAWDVLGERVTCKSAGTATGGAYSLFEVLSPAGGGVPLHLHRREDEAFYLLAGELLVRVEDYQFRAAAGAFVRFPRGTPHAYRNVGGCPARLLVIVSPGGYERFFEAMSQVKVPPEMDEVMGVARQFDLEVIGPPPEG